MKCMLYFCFKNYIIILPTKSAPANIPWTVTKCSNYTMP